MIREKVDMLIRVLVLPMAVIALTGCGDGKQAGHAADSVFLTISSVDQFDSEVLKSDLPVLVDFWATWCPPCRKMNPIVEEAAGMYSKALYVAKVDLDKNRKLAERFQIRAVPTFILFYKGEVVSAHEGAMRASSFKNWIQEHLKELGVDVTQTTT